MEIIIVIISILVVIIALAIFMLKYLRGDFDYRDEEVSVNYENREIVVRRVYHNGRVEYLMKKFKF